MNLPFAYADLIILAIFAVFIFYKLWQILGQRTGKEKPSSFLDIIKQSGFSAKPSEDAKLNTKESMVVVNDVVQEDNNIAAIKKIDAGFDEKMFLQGARLAYDSIVTAFSRGELAELQSLISIDVMKRFEAVLAERKQQDKHTDTTIVAAKQESIQSIALQGAMARIVVRFVTEAIIVIRDSNNNIVSGDQNKILNITDECVFTRHLQTKNPNWLLVEIVSVTAPTA